MVMYEFPEKDLQPVEGGITAPQGFRALGTSGGIKLTGGRDIGLIYSEFPAIASGVFTTNLFKAAPVKITMSRINNPIRAIIVNSGNANSLTGKEGLKDAEEMVKAVEKALRLPEGSVLVASTGVIGRRLNMKNVLYGIKKLTDRILEESDVKAFAEAIMTTDRKMKITAYKVMLKENTYVTIGGVAKGAGMISPNLATMLAFITTDALIKKDLLDEALKEAVEETFNKITIDGDQSTNDMVIVLANGLMDKIEINEKDEVYERFKRGLKKVCEDLAMEIVQDGEGATKVIKITVKNALRRKDAVEVARNIANSLLVKTMFFGESPNWGRILVAIGKSDLAGFREEKLEVVVNKIPIFRNGEFVREKEADAEMAIKQRKIEIEVDLGVGVFSETIWTTDLSYDYIKINAHYT